MNKKRLYIVIAIVLVLATLLILWAVSNNKEETISLQEEIVPEEPKLLFNIPIDDWTIYNDTVREGDLLGAIMGRYGITSQQVDKIAKMSTDDFRVTLIVPDKPFTVFSDTIVDGVPQAQIFVYENTPVVYTSYDFRTPDTIIIKRERKEIDTLTREATGVIQSSLWNAMVGKGYPWELAILLSQTFAWTVDFYALQPEDWFKVIYTEHQVEGQLVGVGEIKAGVFYHGGKELWAIPFVQDSIRNFYDTAGVNMKKSFMLAPLKYTRVSSRYSGARMHPVHHKVRKHLAVDFAAPSGTPVYAASDGRIVIRQYSRGAGNYVKIKHNSVYSTVYMHFSRFGKYQVGDWVAQGDIIGYVGSTGWSTGPHLHYEIHENGVKINPLAFKPPPADPVDSANMKQFNIDKQQWIEKLNKIK